MPNGQQAGVSRILIADDDAAILQTVSWVLEEHGYEVATATGGLSVLEQLELRTPDLVLLDVLMPDADGYQVLERIKSDARWRDVRVMMISAVPPEEGTVRTLGLGASDFIRKPFRVKELLARIQLQLRLRAQICATRDVLRATEDRKSTRLNSSHSS